MVDPTGKMHTIKPSLMLNELKYILGDSLYYLSIQNLYDKWKLKHVNEDRIISSIEHATQRELNWFFDAWLHDTRLMDYKINSWSNKKMIRVLLILILK